MHVPVPTHYFPRLESRPSGPRSVFFLRRGLEARCATAVSRRSADLLDGGGRVTESCCTSLDPRRLFRAEAKNSFPDYPIVRPAIRLPAPVQNDDMLGGNKSSSLWKSCHVAGNMEQISCAFPSSTAFVTQLGTDLCSPLSSGPLDKLRLVRKERKQHICKLKNDEKLKKSRLPKGLHDAEASKPNQTCSISVWSYA